MMNSSELDKKIVTVSSLIGADRQNPEHLVTRSGYFLEKGNHNRALEDATAAMNLDSNCVLACVAAAKAKIKMGKFDEAYDFYKEALKIDSKNPEVVNGLVKLQDLIMADLEKKGPKEDSYNAVNLCSQDIYPGDDELFRLEQEILAAKYKITNTITMNQKGITIADQKEANREAILGHQCHVTGKIDDALHHCDVSLSKDATNSAARYLRAQINIERKNLTKAMQDLWLIPKPRRNADIWKMGGKDVW